MRNDRIHLTLPPHQRWLPVAEGAIRRYAGLLEFPHALEDMIASSILEACEELLRRGKDAGIANEYSLTLDFHSDALAVEISYNGRIPLNPHLAEDYEVPEAPSDLDSLDLDALWLHLIKKQMDRVFFQVRGEAHVLKMIKYRRGEGGERRLWALGLSPALKAGLDAEWIERDARIQGGLLRDLGSGKVLRLGAHEALAVRKMNGRTSLYEIYLESVETLGPVSPHRMTALFEAMEAAGMIADPEQHGKVGRLRAVFRKMINPVFSIPRSDAFVDVLYRFVRPAVGSAGLLVCLVIGFSGMIPLAETFPHLNVSFADIEEAVLARPWVLFALYALVMLMAAVHELGHGLVCKRYGGHVPRLGVMFYLASFIFFCDTTSSWNFPKKYQRIMVSLGGPLTTFAFLGAGLWAAAHYSGTRSFWEPVWLMFCLVCFFGLVMSFNPFIRMDAYYMLMDLSGIPNLRQRSFRFLERQITGIFSKGKRRREREPEPKQRAFLWLYGLVGAAVTVIFFIWPMVFYGRLLINGSPSKGRVVLGVIILSLSLMRLGHSTYRKLHSMRYREYKLA
jgi:putative peptide zinc metalloprotease protein